MKSTNLENVRNKWKRMDEREELDTKLTSPKSTDSISHLDKIALQFIAIVRRLSPSSPHKRNQMEKREAKKKIHSKSVQISHHHCFECRRLWVWLPCLQCAVHFIDCKHAKHFNYTWGHQTRTQLHWVMFTMYVYEASQLVRLADHCNFARSTRVRLPQLLCSDEIVRYIWNAILNGFSNMINLDGGQQR